MMIRGGRLGRAGPLLVAALLVGSTACSKGDRLRLGDDAIASIRKVVTTGADSSPVDAAPAADGSVIYYTTASTTGGAVLRVPTKGGTSITLASGAPLVEPVGLAVATDGSRVFVADAAANRIFVVPANGGPPTVLAGSEGRSPRGLDVTVRQGTDVVYFTGTDPADRSPGLFSIPAVGGSVTAVAKGAPLVSLDGVVVTAGGEAYVTDRGTAAAGGETYETDRGTAANQGAVFKVAGATVMKIATVELGDLGGVSITQDEKTLLVSSQNPATGADQVLTIDLASAKTGVVTKVVGANHNSSSGLHRAHASTRFAWCDWRRGGSVYLVAP